MRARTDWQNGVFLLFIVICIISAKFIFKRSLEFNHARSHGVGHSDSALFAFTGKDVTGTKASGAAQAGYGGEAPPSQDGVALQNTVSRAAGATSHYTKPKRFSDEHVDAEPAQGAPSEPAEGVPSVTETGITVNLQAGRPESLWSRSLKSPALLIAMAGYLFAVTTICVSSITEFTTPTEAYLHVGFGTQFTLDGVQARLQNIGGAVVWQIIGVVLMTLSQAVIRHVTFGDIDLVGEITGQTYKAKQEGYGMNVAAAIIEAGAITSSGLVAAANVYGAPKGIGEDLASVGIFFVLSQLGFIVYTKVFDCLYINNTIQEAVTKKLEPQYQIQFPHSQKKGDRGNVAVAISYSCMMVSFAMLLSNAVYKSYELANFGVWFVGGGALQLIMREVLDRLIAPRRDLDDALDHKHNWGFACVIGALQLSISRVLASLMEDTCMDFKYTEGPGGPTPEEIAICSGQPAGVCDPCAKPVASCTSDTDATCARAFASAPNTTSESCAPGCNYTPGGTECATREGACAMPDTECIAFVGASQLGLIDSLMQYEQMLSLFQLQNLLALGIILFFLFVAKYTYQVTYCIRLKAWQEGDQFQLMKEICEEGNSAVAISFSGYLFGIGTLLSGLFRDLRQLGMNVDAVQDQTFDAEAAAGFTQFTSDLLWVGIGFGMMLVVQVINDFVIFWKYNNAVELYGVTDKDGKVTGAKNVALACVEAGHFIGAAFMIAACIQAENIALGIVFFGIGEVCLCLWSVAYECTTKYDDRAAIQGKNVAAGLNWGLNLVAMGLLLSRALYTSNSVIVFVVWFGCGTTVMLVVRKFIDYCVFPEIDLDSELSNLDAAGDKTEEQEALAETTISSENWGMALIAGTMTISFVQCLNTFLRDCPFEENLW
jgi:uncharacterized membrane protein YjfL (UPF0719 family)